MRFALSSEHMQKILIFVSTGRCGTTRLGEILREKLPADKYQVEHQVSISRLANVLGNLMYYIGNSERIKKWIFNKLLRKYAKGKHFISTDPLTAMVIPKEILNRKETYIIHVTREPKSFAKSFYNFSRGRALSFIAHNFVPLWQPTVWPLENIVNPKIQKKYERVNWLKNRWFEKQYSSLSNYHKIPFEEIFEGKLLQETVNKCLGENLTITDEDLGKKSNKSSFI
ncbi:MAG: hypothetical protein C0599_14465 [Salinivirgaceae bacterium]|nr:MAG: hypothetical protein C0599_14465 [Salinivirgaceae bacterium]